MNKQVLNYTKNIDACSSNTWEIKLSSEKKEDANLFSLNSVRPMTNDFIWIMILLGWSWLICNIYPPPPQKKKSLQEYCYVEEEDYKVHYDWIEDCIWFIGKYNSC